MSGLRAALVKIKSELEVRSDEGEAHLFLNIPFWQLEELLAEYPDQSLCANCEGEYFACTACGARVEQS